MTGLPIYDRVMDEVADLFHPRHYHDPSTPATPAPEEPAMDLATLEQDGRQALQNVISHGEQLVTDARNVLENHLPAIIGEASKVQGSPIVQLVESLALTPAEEQALADGIAKMASLFHPTAPAPAEPAAPADVAMGEQLPPQPTAGPVVAGQA